MCDYEKNILKLLTEEKTRLDKLFVTRDASYMRSLDAGIKTAEQKLQQCEQKECIAQVHKNNRDLVPASDIRRWAEIQFDIHRCTK